MARCTGCAAEHMGIHGALANGASGGDAACAAASASMAAAVRQRADTQRAGSGRGRPALPGRSLAGVAPPPPQGGGLVPTNGAAVVVRDCFQTTLSFLWISEAFAHIAMSEFANTITITDLQVRLQPPHQLPPPPLLQPASLQRLGFKSDHSAPMTTQHSLRTGAPTSPPDRPSARCPLQLSNAHGPCSICAAGGIGPPVGLPSANMNRTRVDILQITRLTAVRRNAHSQLR